MVECQYRADTSVPLGNPETIASHSRGCNVLAHFAHMVGLVTSHWPFCFVPTKSAGERKLLVVLATKPR